MESVCVPGGRGKQAPVTVTSPAGETAGERNPEPSVQQPLGCDGPSNGNFPCFLKICVFYNTIQMSLGDMMLSERSQTRRATCCRFHSHVPSRPGKQRQNRAADASAWAGEWRMTASGCEVSSRGDESVLSFYSVFLNICFY